MPKTLLSLLVATGVAATLQAQGPCFDLSIGTNLNLFDDDTAQGLPLGFTFTYNGVGYTDICVCSNGYIWFGASAPFGGDYTPTEAELLSSPQPRVCPLWTDFNTGELGSGQIYYDNTTPGVAKVTWAGVAEFGSSNFVEMQVILDSSNHITITYGPTAAIGGSLSAAVILGASPGGASVSNPVTFATRPFVITQNNFAEVLPTTGTTPIPYSGFKMKWTALTPGYSVADLACTPNGFPLPAGYDLVGTGCPAPSGPAIFEQFDSFIPNPADLSGLNLSFLPIGVSDFLIMPGLSPTWFAGFTNLIPMGDDVTVSFALPFAFPYNGGVVTSIYISSNGFLTLGPVDPFSGCCYGDPFSLVNGPPRIAGWWSDLYPPGGGGVYADLDGVSGDFVVTWNNVPEYFSGPPQTFQIALSPSGQFTIRWQNVSHGNHTWLAGYSLGGGVPEPAPTDLSGITTQVLSGAVATPLALDATPGSVPQVGGSFSLDVSNIAPSPNGNICILVLSLEIAPVDLTFLGLTGCNAYLALPELLSFLHFTLGSPTDNFTTNIPLDPVLYNVQIMSQAVSDDVTANPFGFKVSNGLRWKLGL